MARGGARPGAGRRPKSKAAGIKESKAIKAPEIQTPEIEAPLGRPSSYSAAVGDLICDLLAHGKSLVMICQLENMPHYSTVMRWIQTHETFRENYARAREDQAEYYANEIIDIADELPECELPQADGGKDKRVDAAGVQRNKLRVDARKWIAAKLLPKKYGEKVEVDAKHSGTVGVTLVNSVPRPKRD